tara:strand:+ start:515 stop:736 length:222 start_codon:yes stop_codon:yes gene_type:complete
MWQSVVGINSWVAHANTDVFGPDAAVFRPERWLESKEKSTMLDKYFFSVSLIPVRNSGRLLTENSSAWAPALA